MRIKFAPIDCKGGESYSPVDFMDATGLPIELTQEQEKLQILMVQEYLVRVAMVQDQIAAKYAEEFAGLKTATPAGEDFCWGKALNKVDYEAAKKVAKEAYPGRKAEYYT